MNGDELRSEHKQPQLHVGLCKTIETLAANLSFELIDVTKSWKIPLTTANGNIMPV